MTSPSSSTATRRLSGVTSGRSILKRSSLSSSAMSTGGNQSAPSLGVWVAGIIASCVNRRSLGPGVVGSIDLLRRSRSTHGHERNRLVVVIPGGARGLGVERGLAVHQEAIEVMAMGQQHLNKPATIHLLVHGCRVPLIEIAGDLHGFGTRRS